MNKSFFITSTEYNTQKRETKKHGTVYDVYFYVYDEFAELKQKKLSGFKTLREAKMAFSNFVSEQCNAITDLDQFREEAQARRKALQSVPKSATTANNVPLSVAAEHYLRSLPDNKESTVYDKRKILERYVLSTLGGMYLSDLTKQTLYEWQDRLWAMCSDKTGKRFSHTYCVKIRAHLSSLLSWCAERYNVPNELEKVKIPKRKVKKKPTDFWERSEFEKFIAVVDDPMWYTLFNLMFYTGHRKSEIFALQKDDIMPNGTPFIRFSKSVMRKTNDKSPYKIVETKTYRDDTVPICDTLADILREYEFEKPFAFGGDKPLAENTVARKLDEYAKKAGVKRITVHGLRHSFVSMLVHYHAPVPVVADLIGDTPEQVMKTYAHLWEEAPYNALAAIDKHTKPNIT